MKKVFTLVAMFTFAVASVAAIGCGGETKKTTTVTSTAKTP